MFSDVLQNGNSVLKKFYDSLNTVSAHIKVVNQAMFLKYEEIIDLQMQLVNLNFVVLDYKNNDFSEIILSICYKNMISIISALDLIKKGYLGSAKIIFRNIYEGLIIAKYIGVTHDMKIYNKWIRGENISLNQYVFRRLLMPSSNESREFWDILNKYNHSTIYSQDFMLEMDNKELSNCNAIITVLIAMNSHLLNVFVSNYYVYYLKKYFSSNFINLKKKLNSNLAFIIKLIDNRCKIVIGEYKSNWIFI